MGVALPKNVPKSKSAVNTIYQKHGYELHHVTGFDNTLRMGPTHNFVHKGVWIWPIFFTSVGTPSPTLNYDVTSSS